MIQELAVHGEVEELIFYPRLRAAVPEGDDLAEEAVHEHLEIKETLNMLDGMTAEDDGFDERMRTLIDAAHALALVQPRPGGQERAAGGDQVQVRQVLDPRHLLGAQVLLHRHRVVGAALDRRVIGDDHDHARRGDFSRWVRDVLSDHELARELGEIEQGIDEAGGTADIRRRMAD